jgi:hypothetical protein
VRGEVLAQSGNASDARALERGAALGPIAEQAWALAQRCAPWSGGAHRRRPMTPG